MINMNNWTTFLFTFLYTQCYGSVQKRRSGIIRAGFLFTGTMPFLLQWCHSIVGKISAMYRNQSSGDCALTWSVTLFCWLILVIDLFIPVIFCMFFWHYTVEFRVCIYFNDTFCCCWLFCCSCNL